LEADIFDRNLCEAVVAEENQIVIGFAIYYTSYSTWKGPCIYLEDLYVLPEKRNQQTGSKLFDAVVEIAKDRGVQRMDWQILEWNERAIDFYKRKGATIDPEWYNGRLFFESTGQK
jgi:GNAT superfamily N-acetyltransferase